MTLGENKFQSAVTFPEENCSSLQRKRESMNSSLEKRLLRPVCVCVCEGNERDRERMRMNPFVLIHEGDGAQELRETMEV